MLEEKSTFIPKQMDFWSKYDMRNICWPYVEAFYQLAVITNRGNFIKISIDENSILERHLLQIEFCCYCICLNISSFKRNDVNALRNSRNTSNSKYNLKRRLG